jgi:Protein of unknown function (DUF1350)
LRLGFELTIFKPVYTCWVAEHPQPIGTIEFLGGALFGVFPTIFYSSLLRYLYGQGFTIVTSPFRLSLDHARVAKEIYLDRERVFDTLSPTHHNLPRFWVGHSLGCKYILLLKTSSEIDKGTFSIKDNPSVLIAPNISDTLKAVRFKWLATYLDRTGRGVNPNRNEVKLKLEKSQRFNLSAIISFGLDTEAGTQKESPEKPDFSDVALITQILANNPKRLLLKTELPKCKHLEPVKIGQATESKKLTNTVQYYSFLVLK